MGSISRINDLYELSRFGLTIFHSINIFFGQQLENSIFFKKVKTPLFSIQDLEKINSDLYMI